MVQGWFEAIFNDNGAENFFQYGGRHVGSWDATGEAIRVIEILKELMVDSSIDAGVRGEFIALLLTLARDEVVASVEEEAHEECSLHPLSLAGAGDHGDHWRPWVDLDATPLELIGQSDVDPVGADDAVDDSGVSNGNAEAARESPARPTKRTRRC
ncbi:hypothetical protein HGRIS_005722 [Hohenbuehelia grisea]|uniref:Uncharacterized protein n=1 Tax=Hohenbuehelia grisea TaxID=104357 RepID=A0ABR3JYM1_9AGAR